MRAWIRSPIPSWIPWNKSVLERRSGSEQFDYLFVHVPDVLELNVVLIDRFFEEGEIFVDDASVQSLSATFLKTARHLNLY